MLVTCCGDAHTTCRVISRLYAQIKQYEEQLAAVGSQVERCIKDRDRVLATLGRVEDLQVEGVDFCGITCFMIMLRTSRKS